MTRTEAISLLAACVPLANRLTALGVDIPLTSKDRTALAGFNQVWFAEWLDDPDIHRQAGLSSNDIWVLNFVVTQVQGEKMRRQHASGEQDD